MSNKLDNIGKELKDSMSMLMISMYALIAVSFIKFESRSNQELLDVIIIMATLPIFLYSYRIFKISRTLKSNKKLLRQIRDERAINIDLRAQSVAFITFSIISGAYLFISIVAKILFKNNYFFDLPGYFIAAILMIIVGLSHTLSALYYDYK